MASITSTTWSGCSIPGIAFTFTQSGVWGLHGDGSNATSSSESIAGHIGAVVFRAVSTASPGVCSFTVSGQLNTIVDETTQQLVINETGYTGNLTLSNVGACLGQLQNGNRANLVSTLTMAIGDGAVNLS